MSENLALKLDEHHPYDPRLDFDPNDSQDITPGFDPRGNSYSNLAELKLCLQVAVDQIERGEYIAVTDTKKFFDDIRKEVFAKHGIID
ncbi:MAG: hypothetical protein ORO03_11560 [Alphaproteobacteria bacterium]|nr:hypothetical protein [Alphaproteobacteria bacterium]